MQTLHTALVAESLDRRIKISTPHSLGILASSSPPSSGKFRPGYDTHVIKPLLSFLRATNSPFMINPYPFFWLLGGNSGLCPVSAHNKARLNFPGNQTPGGACFVPDTVQAHAAYVMNLYYQAMGRNDYDCDFEQTVPSRMLIQAMEDATIDIENNTTFQKRRAIIYWVMNLFEVD
ncbi:O-Glycosyl hydrolases family 17 protein [Actinidia rufa]|uniref:O-Glycosyl hydrolases family 17 protein n=1 Tax=Actinidia rufa TaxID=165716 RepID=A0A7J0EBX3_9ERIC|nr:O-Glycosyl hydrolases family 17 protein [Actinidia rufa]